MRRLFVVIVLLLCANATYAQESDSLIIGGDTLTYRYIPIDQSQSTVRDGGSDRSFFAPIHVGQDGYMSFMVAPVYSTETNFGIAVAANYSKYEGGQAGVYDQRKVSDVSLSACGSISGFYTVAIDGEHHLDRRRVQRLGYGVAASSEPSRIWGLDYVSARVGEYHKYTEKEYSAYVRYALSFNDLTVGLLANYRYVSAARLDDGAARILADEALEISTVGVGVSVAYDMRKHRQSDGVIRGIYAAIGATYYPKLFSNVSGDMIESYAQFDYYQPLWRGAILAFDLYGSVASKNTPWLILPQLGGDSRMRGYYSGRYRGNYLASAQLELRQHIWRGIGVVAWGGVGTVCSKGVSIDRDMLLPTYGAGLRYSYESLTIRFDVGFGRDGHNFILGLNEAF